MKTKYTKVFDCNSQYWNKSDGYNSIFLISRETWATSVLRSRGYLFLNEVYDMLDLPRTKNGQIMGWSLDKESLDFKTISFNSRKRNGKNEFVLNIEVDGSIIDLLPEE